MAIRFPDFPEPSLEAFSACARVAAEDENDSWPSRSQTKVSRLEPSSDVMVRLILNRQDDPAGLHVHVDMARERAFRTVPKTNSSVSEISDLISRCCGGANLSIRPKVEFVIPPSDLPPKGLIALMMGDKDAPVRMTGASYQVGSTEVEWKIRRRREEEDKVHVAVESERTVQFSERYLIDSLEYMRRIFRGVILEDAPYDIKVK